MLVSGSGSTSLDPDGGNLKFQKKQKYSGPRPFKQDKQQQLESGSPRLSQGSYHSLREFLLESIDEPTLKIAHQDRRGPISHGVEVYEDGEDLLVASLVLDKIG